MSPFECLSCNFILPDDADLVPCFFGDCFHFFISGICATYCTLSDIIREKRLCLQIVGSITIDCRNGQTDPMSEAFLQMAGVFSQLELAMIRARVKSGMANAKAKGKQIGRRPTTKDDIPAIFFRHYPTYASGKMNVSELARVCVLSRPTVYKYLTLLK